MGYSKSQVSKNFQAFKLQKLKFEAFKFGSIGIWSGDRFQKLKFPKWKNAKRLKFEVFQFGFFF